MISIDFLNLDEAEKLAVKWPDVYFSPGYGRAAATMDSGSWELAVGNHGQFLYPSIKRPIQSDGGLPLYDIASPYGYAGVWAAPGTTDSDWTTFRRTFRELSKERGCVAEFLRLGSIVPGREELLASDNELAGAPFNSTILVTLKDGHDAYWKSSEGRSRTAIRKAQRLGYVARIRQCTAEDLEQDSPFRLLYETTMSRLGARGSYYFSNEYYASLLQALGGKLLMGEVFDSSGVLGSSALFMQWNGILHYHLAGSKHDAARDGANNLLIDAAVNWGIENGCESLHLGGGTSDNDGLFRFKASFGGERLEFWLARSILNQGEYDRLAEVRARELSLPRADLLARGFFPAYRTP